MMDALKMDRLLSIELEIVQELLIKHTRSGDSRFDAISQDWLSKRGKMLRPVFYLLSSRFGEEEAKLRVWQEMAINTPDALRDELLNNEKQMKFYRGAAAIELIHMATLIHDDVVDEAKLRRGRESIQSAYGKDYAIYMGDFYFCKAVLMVADHEKREGLKSMAEAMTQVCLGEIRQYHSRHLLQPDLRNYFKIIASKTAALFSLSLFAGAIESGCSKEISMRLGKVGYNLGMAFQIIDDLLDFKKDDKTGKETFKDLSQGNINLPIHLALMSPNADEIKNLLDGSEFSLDSFMRVMSLIKTSHADEQASDFAQKYTKRAHKYLRKMPDHPSKAAIGSLMDEMLMRQK